MNAESLNDKKKKNVNKHRRKQKIKITVFLSFYYDIYNEK